VDPQHVRQIGLNSRTDGQRQNPHSNM
jgi:hypothetical protein